MRVKYKLLDRIKNVTSTEMDFFLYIARKQDIKGCVTGVHNQDVCRHTGMCKQSFYTAMRGLEKKGVIQCRKASEMDYDIRILDNDFSYEGAFREGYIDLQRRIFHRKSFQRLKAKEKWLLMYFLHITHENSSSYRIGTKTFYNKFTKLLGVTKRVIRSYLQMMRAFFSIGIVKGNYYITYRRSVFEPRENLGVEQVEHENFVEAQIRRNKIRKVSTYNFLETVKLIKQYRQIASGDGEDIYNILAVCIRSSVQEKKHPKDRTLNVKYIHKLVRKELALA